MNTATFTATAARFHVALPVGLRTSAQVAARLDRSLALLHVGQRGGMRHHQTMAAAVDWGYRLLGDLEQVVFLRLSVLLGGWTLDGAAAVCEDLGLSRLQGGTAPARPPSTVHHKPRSIGRRLLIR